MRRNSFPFLLILGILTHLVSCKNRGEDPICAKEISINEVLPFTGTVKGPVLIKGKGFSEQVEVYFNEVPATIYQRNDSSISTHVPSALAGTEGIVQISVVDQDCEASGTIAIAELGSSWGVFTVNAPFFVIQTKPSSLPIIYPTIDCPSSTTCERKLINPYGSELNLTETFFRQNNKHLNSRYLGSEFASGLADIEGTYMPKENRVVLTRNHPFSTEKETLIGGFFELKLSTPTGTKSGTFLVLTSQTTGYPYIYEPN